ncbi:disease resistance protein RPV1-like [Pyrus x bretschneideri]|uniref:disease resistance protein RPV1-like n=1 Tax=Pyrus x bretschneideri TaxID=225117 RepID=UPI00202EB6DA|nr:disease resistance protein RPV1-like [Pyrus x bretschneideri]
MEIENKEENRRKRNRSGDDDDTDCEGSKARRQDVVDIASSSSSTADADDTKKYDVFISFRGEDTRRTFTSHLHAALLEKKITTYIDDKLKRGDEIAPALLQAIKESELSVIIFSKDYASSTWCLDELVRILACKEKHGQFVIPIFYDTLPSDVRKQRGSYEVAFAQLEQRFQNSIDKVHKWRDALTKAADISGFDSKNYGTDADLVKKVVEDIWTKLCRASSCDLKGFVGIESRIKQVESLLGIHSSDACITVGIWGMGGIGKTTLAETIFHKLSSKFEASCFVKNVRENSEKAGGLDHLETTLLKEILKEEGLSMGSTSVRKRLSRTKVLIVLDDVSRSMQIERLAGDRLRYGTGSRILITTRDRGTLGQTVEENDIYEVEVLKPDDALQLFCSRAFKNNSTRIIDCKELAEKAVAYAKGLPLALTVLGSLFFNCKSKEEWEDVFNKLKRFPSEDIQEVLRISYDRLGENEKEIFLDIACFHTGQSLVEVKQMLDARGFFATDGIRILKDMSLISIDSELETIPVVLEMDDFPQEMGRETIVMHDLLQEMGGKIVQEQGNKDPGKRSRLFNDGDVYRVLSSNMETPNVEVIKVYWPYIEKRSLKHVDFKKMSNLEMLIVQCSFLGPPYSLDLPDSLRYLEWWGYQLESLPSKFSPENLVELHMSHSGVKELWKEAQILVNLQVIDLSFSKDLIKVPNLSRSLEIVKINLWGCDSLVEIPLYFQHLDKLIHLNLGYCRSLKYLPKMPGSIQYLDLECTGIKEVPESVWSNENISYLNISDCKDLKKLPSSRCKLKSFSGSLEIVKINLGGCTSLVEIPSYFQHLDKLIHLNLEYCKSLKYLPKMPGSIQYLNLECTGIKELPESVWSNENISYLNLKHCEDLKKLPSSRCKLKNLENLDLDGCSNVENLPEIWEPMEHLKSLSLIDTKVTELPSSICKLKYLESLDLTSCSRFSKFPEILKPMEHLKSLSLFYTAVTELPSSICNLKYLESIDLTGCLRFSKFPEILKPMEHLVSLCLEGTAFEMLPSSIGNLNRLQDLNLSRCRQLKDFPTSISSLTNLKRLKFNGCRRLEKLPSTLCFRSLEELELSDSGILEIPASIKQASRLSMLDLGGCGQLQSIPELPALCDVHAQACTSLKIVSSSRTALTQGWDKPHCFKVFTNCPKLDDNSRSNIMDEAQIAIMRMATVAPLKDYCLPHNPWPHINIICPGKEIPNWFSYQNEGSSVDIELCPDWFRTGLFGFALSVVSCDVWSVRANFIVKFMGESHELFSSKYIIPGNSSNYQHHVHVWNEAFRSEEVGKNCSPDVYKLAKEASVVFYLEPGNSASKMKVESCGICPLYAEDAEKFKFGHVFKSRGPKVEEETRQDDDSKGGGSSDESEANDSD